MDCLDETLGIPRAVEAQAVDDERRRPVHATAGARAKVPPHLREIGTYAELVSDTEHVELETLRVAQDVEGFERALVSNRVACISQNFP